MLKNLFLAENKIITAILINAVVITALYFPELRNNKFLNSVDQFFIYFFIIEALVKIRTLGAKIYFSNSWNRFDFIVVLGSIPSLLISFLPVPDTSGLLLLRLFRLVKIVHLLKFVPDIKKILSGLLRAIKASFFVLLALAFLNFMLALLTCHFYAEIAPKYFGDPLTSFFSVFQIFTLEGWNDIAEEITQNITSKNHDTYLEVTTIITLSRLYFMFVVLIGGVFGLSLANAVFVDEMTMDNNEELENKVNLLVDELAEIKSLLIEKGSLPDSNSTDVS